MAQRQPRTKPELEAICLMALQGQLGCGHLDHVEIGPYCGPKGWTWQVVAAGPDCLKTKEASDVIRIFQENFDLKTAGRA